MNTLPSSEDFGNVRQSSEDFGSVPNNAETFGTVPHTSEPFRNIRKSSERTESHTLTVRESARRFEQASVPRTERSIINWCQPNRQGVARLDAFFDENERRYYITPQSVDRAIEEERARRPLTAARPSSEAEIPKRSEASTNHRVEENGGDKRETERQYRDLEIATRAKDYYIERLEKERGQFVERLVGMSRYVGELETQVFQLGGEPRGDRTLPQRTVESGDVPNGGIGDRRL